MAKRGFNRRTPPIHGWDYILASDAVVLGADPLQPYLIGRALQSYSGYTNTLASEPDPFYCQRIMIDIFPYLARVDATAFPRRIWQYMLCTAGIEEMAAWVEQANTLALASFWNGTSELWGVVARVLQQGVAPVYADTEFPQEGVGGPVFTGASGSAEVFEVTASAGPERVHIDIEAKFSLREDQALWLLTGPTATVEWEDGDEFLCDVFMKALWTKRRD